MSLPNQLESALSRVTNDIAKQHEKILFDELNFLIQRGLLVVVQTKPTLVQDFNGTVELRQGIKLVLKDQEYIEKLEQEIKQLRDTIISYHDNVMALAKVQLNERK